MDSQEVKDLPDFKELQARQELEDLPDFKGPQET
jgi:hypothetical protein